MRRKVTLWSCHLNKLGFRTAAAFSTPRKTLDFSTFCSRLFANHFQTLWSLSKLDLDQCFIRLAPLSKEKKDLSVPRTNVKMMVMLREKRVSFPITFVAKIGFANRPTTIISIALAALKWWLHHHHHFFKILSREWMTLIHLFFVLVYQGKCTKEKRSELALKLIFSVVLVCQHCRHVIWWICPVDIVCQLELL